MNETKENKKEKKEKLNNKNPEQIKITNLKDFEIEREISSSNDYIKIFKVLRKIDKKHYILLKYPLNIITNSINNFKKLEKILENVKVLLKKINHINILNIKESFIEKTTESVIMILELFDNKTIQNNIIAKYKIMRDRYIPENVLLDYLYNIIEGLSILHKNNIFNINLSPQNIYFDGQNLKLNPYITLENLSSTKNCNNDYYKVQAPELLKENKNYTLKTDIWYLGLLIYEISQLKPIDKNYFDIDNNQDNIYIYIIKGNYSFTNYYSNDIKELIKLCLQYSQHKRPSATELLKIIEIYRNNRILTKKLNNIKNNKISYNFKRKINLKEEILKINNTLSKIKNYEKKPNYKIHRELTPIIIRKNNNFSFNINTKKIIYKNTELSSKVSNKPFKRTKLKLKTSLINNSQKLNLTNKTGKKFFAIHKNNETLNGYLKTNPFNKSSFVLKNPFYLEYERNKTPNNFLKIKQKSFIYLRKFEDKSLWKETKYRKLNEYIKKGKNLIDNKKDFKRAKSVNYYKINRKFVIDGKKIINNKINKLKTNYSLYNRNNREISKSFC